MRHGCLGHSDVTGFLVQLCLLGASSWTLGVFRIGFANKGAGLHPRHTGLNQQREWGGSATIA